MPHLSIDCSPGLSRRADMNAVAQAAHRAMVETGIFPLAGIRVRLHCADIAIIADGLVENDFLAMTLSVGAGRPQEVLKAAGDRIFWAVQAALAGPLASTHFALSLGIRVADPVLSWRDNPIHTRFSGEHGAAEK